MDDSVAKATSLSAETLRWRCEQTKLGFETTADVQPIDGVLAQPTAHEALEFGVKTTARGQNVYVRGPRGTGRKTMVREKLERIQRQVAEPCDRCYVHNFKRPDRPRLLSLPGGCGRRLRRHLRELADFIGRDLPKALESEALAAERRTLQEEIQKRIEEMSAPLENDIDAAGMKLVTLAQGADRADGDLPGGRRPTGAAAAAQAAGGPGQGQPGAARAVRAAAARVPEAPPAAERQGDGSPARGHREVTRAHRERRATADGRDHQLDLGAVPVARAQRNTSMRLSKTSSRTA